jgi:hypothetical protein
MGIVRSPDSVKHPRTPTKLEENPTRIICEYINPALVTFCWLAPECTPVCVRRWREIYVEMRVLRECKMFVAFEMAEVPKNLWQHRSAAVVESPLT